MLDTVILTRNSMKHLFQNILIPEDHPLDNRKVIVHNVFDKSLFYKEFEIDFAKVDTPVLSASFSNDHSQLNLTYLTEEFVETTTTIMLNQSYDPT